MQQTMLKKRIVRHESRSPRSNIAGPRVPAENLGGLQPKDMDGSRTDESMLKFIANQMKKILLYGRRVLSSSGTG